MKDLISKVFYNEKFADTRIGTNSKYDIKLRFSQY